MILFSDTKLIELARDHIYEVLHLPHNFRGKVIYEGYQIDEKNRKKLEKECAEKAKISNPHSLSIPLDADSAHAKSDEEDLINDQEEEFDYLGNDDNESYYYNESDTIVNRYDLACVIIDHEFSLKNYEYV